ncbi:MAG: hypothetical protein LBC97_06340 [Bifidobacteriaceae bacterium]|jgi:hypothetical protein|nr:hypothetical protein [Bifidobacteriaceae bacterium]
MAGVMAPDLRADAGKRPGPAMPIIGVALIVISPAVDFGLGLLGMMGAGLNSAHWEIAGSVVGATVFLIGLNLLVLGLIRRSRHP